MHKNFDKYNKPKEGPVIEKIKQGQTFVISGKTEGELVGLAIKIALKLESIEDQDLIEFESKRYKEDILSGEELRPLGYAIYLRKGRLYVDSRNHRNDNEMKLRLEAIVNSVIS